jgi:hypothetical protein
VILPEINKRRRGHRFYPIWTDEVPALRSTEGQDDPMVRAHYFVGSWDWYVVEWDPETGEAFGFVKGLDEELGYFSLVEMEATLARGLFPIERDLYWDPVPLSTITRTVRA